MACLANHFCNIVICYFGIPQQPFQGIFLVCKQTCAQGPSGRNAQAIASFAKMIAHGGNKSHSALPFLYLIHFGRPGKRFACFILVYNRQKIGLSGSFWNISLAERNRFSFQEYFYQAGHEFYKTEYPQAKLWPFEETDPIASRLFPE